MHRSHYRSEMWRRHPLRKHPICRLPSCPLGKVEGRECSDQPDNPKCAVMHGLDRTVCDHTVCARTCAHWCTIYTTKDQPLVACVGPRKKCPWPDHKCFQIVRAILHFSVTSGEENGPQPNRSWSSPLYRTPGRGIHKPAL